MKFFKIKIEEATSSVLYYETEAATAKDAHARAAYFASNKKAFPPRRTDLGLHKRAITVTECLESELEFGKEKK